MKAFQFFVISLLLLGVKVHSTEKKKDKEVPEAEKWKKKHITDYTEADMERLLEQWEEGDDELEDDEQPEWKRPQPKIDLTKLDTNDPESVLKMTKQGKTLMMFATVSGDPTEKETEQISTLWQTSLFNANYELQRYIVGPNRVLFMIKDGSKAWEIKDFLVKQDRCQEVSIENQTYPGKGAKKAKDTGKTSKDSEKKDSTKSNEIKRKKKQEKGKEEL